MNDKEKLLRDYGRMCLTICEDGTCGICPVKQLNLDNICQRNLAENHLAAIEVIERWAKEHPVKTRQSEFLKQFPNAEMMGGSLMIMPCSIDIRLVQTDCCNNSSNCSRCRKEYWLQEVENE